MSIPAYKNVSEVKLILPTYNASVSLSPGQYVVGTYYAFLDGNSDYEKTADYTTLPWVESNQIRYVYPEELLTEETTPPIDSSGTVESSVNKLRLVTPDGYAVSLEADADNLASNLAFVLPIDYGDENDVLVSGGDGTLSWSASSGGSSTINVVLLEGPTHTITNEPHGTLFVDDSADGLSVTLPTPVVPGANYILTSVGGSNVNFTAGGTDSIFDTNGTEGVALWTTGEGETLHLVGTSTTEWRVLSATGTWTITTGGG